MAFPQIRRELFENDGKGPLLRDEIVPWSDIPWSDIPPAAPTTLGGVKFADPSLLVDANGVPSTPPYATWLLTAAGSWTVPETGWYRVWCQGGGGAGGPAIGGPLVAASGGNGGQCVIGVFRLEKDLVIPVTIGVGGFGVIGSRPAPPAHWYGANGGPSSFGSYLTAAGGQGGDGASFVTNNTNWCGPQRGGAAAHAEFPSCQNLGSSGSFATITGSVPTVLFGGSGGSSLFGTGGGIPNAGTSQNGSPGTGFGSGGSGAVAMNTTFDVNGGAGRPGCIKIERIK